MEESYYTSVEDPVALRKPILETAREAISLLQAVEKLQAARAQRVQLIEALRLNIAELTGLLTRLKRSFPSLKTPPRRAEAKARGRPRKSEPALAALESELAEIETKLTDLS